MASPVMFIPSQAGGSFHSAGGELHIQANLTEYGIRDQTGEGIVVGGPSLVVTEYRNSVGTRTCEDWHESREEGNCHW